MDTLESIKLNVKSNLIIFTVRENAFHISRVGLYIYCKSLNSKSLLTM